MDRTQIISRPGGGPHHRQGGGMTNLWKKSRLIRCSCNYIHMAQGPIQCIDCQDGISFEAWAGKPLPEKLPRPLSPGQELNLNGDSRWWNPDPRARRTDKLKKIALNHYEEVPPNVAKEIIEKRSSK